MKSLNAVAISEAIKDIITSCGFNPQNCVGFASDGASVMSGCWGGVQALLLKDFFQRALYVHCQSHRLNLVLVDVAGKLIPEVRDFFNYLGSIASFFNAVTRHGILHDVQKDLYPLGFLWDFQRTFYCVCHWVCVRVSLPVLVLSSCGVVVLY